LEGRQIYFSPAIPRDQVQAQESDKRLKNRDKRNLYLAKEGLIYANSPAAEGVSQADLAKRLSLEQRKRRLLQSLTHFVSNTRLAVHNLPPQLDEKRLRSLFAEAAGDPSAKIIEARIMRKYEKTTKKFGASKGFGFIEFTDHEHALKALRHLNNNPDTFSNEKRPVVEFSIENKVALNKRKRNEQKNQMMAKTRAVTKMGQDQAVTEMGEESVKKRRKSRNKKKRKQTLAEKSKREKDRQRV
jgi:nucleolar protein 4